MQGRAELIEVITDGMRQAGGRIPFVRFMELALYHPQYGYYTGGGPTVGRAGDFFTSVSVGPIFGRLLAGHFRELRRELADPSNFEVVEFGGQRGQLRADVLAAAPELSYRIIEAGEPWPDRIVGCVFSNEFLDSLPVHRVRVEEGEWREVYVTVGQVSRLSDSAGQNIDKRGAGPTFSEITGPLSTPRLAEFLAGLPAHLMEGYTTEVNLRALDWLTEVARHLARGFVLTIDYGYTREDYFAPHRRDGTLLGHYRHTRGADPYRHVGEQDLTAHVEFTSLIERGRRCGLEPVLFTNQTHYLLKTGEKEIKDIVERTAGRLSPERAALHQLLHSSMGQTFKVLMQRKG